MENIENNMRKKWNRDNRSRCMPGPYTYVGINPTKDGSVKIYGNIKRKK